MASSTLRKFIITVLLGALGLTLSGWALADPPSRVARLAYASGSLSFSPGGESDWVRATLNRPMIAGDRLWTDADARAELQLGGTAMRLGPYTSVTLLNLNDHSAQLQLGQGTLNLRVRHLQPGQSFEVDTPNMAYSVRRPGSYRIQVDAAGTSTAVVVRAGQADVYGQGRAFVINAGQSYRFFGSSLSDYESLAPQPPDDFDRWCGERDGRWDRSASARYVSPDMIGYEDLDEYGTWRNVSGYGDVWMPSGVAADWAPYRDGHWAWVEPWGWSWVDDAPWGFAPSHYGRWAHLDSGWGWVPGPIAARPVYAPALVVFVGGSNFRIAINVGSVAAVAWFPLGPRDVYRPSYPVSREYFTRVNTSNSVVNTTNITNVYNNINVTNIVYANRQVPGAVVAVPATAFVQSRPVAREAVRISNETVAAAPVAALAQVAPVHASVLGAAAPANRPPDNVLARPVVAKTAPPRAPVSFAGRQSALAANPGKPLDPAAIAALKPAPALAAPAVKIVTVPQPVAPPPSKKARSAPERTPPQAARDSAPPTEAARPAQVPRTALPAESANAPRNAPRAPAQAQPAAPPPVAVPAPGSPRPVPPAARTPVAPNVEAMKPAEEPRRGQAPESATAPRNVPTAPAAQGRPARPPSAVPPPEMPKSPPLVATPVVPPVGAARPAESGPAPRAKEASAPRQAPPVQRPPEAVPTAQQRGPQTKPERGRAPDKQEAASEAKKADERDHRP